jgi:hypothetical protein
MTDAHASLRISTHPLWVIRLARELPRYLLCAMAVAGLAASARFAIAPPRAAMPPMPRRPSPPDRAAEGFATLFARRYLTWNTADPLAREHVLEPFVGAGMDAAAGLQLPSNARQRVEWIEVVQQREAAARKHVYTLAAQTDTGGLLYLAVTVARGPDGRLALAAYPSLVGAPAAAPAQIAGGLREVADPRLAAVVERALRNYLAASPGELAADLTSAARVSVPGPPLTLVGIQRLDWSPDNRSVCAVLQARDGRGVQYTLAYELDVVRDAGRWEVSAVQMDPNA